MPVFNGACNIPNGACSIPNFPSFDYMHKNKNVL